MILFALAASPIYASEHYGDMRLEQGSLIVVREGKSLAFKDLSEGIKINKYDVVRTNLDTRAIMDTVENTRITLGSNAVFQVMPWKNRNKTGFFRMLFGKAKLKTTALRSKSRKFRMKTAMAVIGIKGTEWWVQATVDGNTSVVTKHGTVGLLGPSGTEQDVNPGQVSIVINGKAASNSAMAPPDLQKSTSDDSINSPSPTDSKASVIVGEETFVELGVATKGDIAESKQEIVAINETFDKDQLATVTQEKEELADEEFESELNESEAIEEEVIEADLDILQLTSVEVEDVFQSESSFDNNSETIDAPQINLDDVIEDVLSKSGSLRIDFEK